MEENIPCKWESKERWGSNTPIRQDRLQNEEYVKGQGRSLPNDQRINPRRYNNFKYLCTQHRFTTIYKATANNLKRRN